MCKDCGCSADKSSQVKLYVQGYDQENARDIERTLLGLPGVYHVHIHIHDGQTTIDYNPLQTPLSDITALLTTRGLQAVV